MRYRCGHYRISWLCLLVVAILLLLIYLLLESLLTRYNKITRQETNVYDLFGAVPADEIEISGNKQIKRSRNFIKRFTIRKEGIDSVDSANSVVHHTIHDHAFNLTASDRIAVDRDVIDTRPRECKRKSYDIDNYPSVSVIICYHNEAWSTLLRTLHSVMNRTPLKLVAEIILVDDASTMPHLGSKLHRYLKQFAFVRKFESQERLGLVGARLLGASKAIGEVLVFLDSHCEVNVDWLQPLLQYITVNPTQIISPVIDIIDYNTFAYKPAPVNSYGVFDWQLKFRWKARPPPTPDSLNYTDETALVMTPVMAGGIFAVDKMYFYDVGAYDEEMKIWGGENIELSVRVWTCHGSVYVSPCSRVGHVFRLRIPYEFNTPGGAAYTIHYNAARLAEGWMDKYKWLYYATQPYEYSPDFTGSLSSRVRLRHRLQCKSFSWFIQHIMPELQPPSKDATYYGLIHSDTECGCMDTSGATTVSCISCQYLDTSQTMTLTTHGRLQSSTGCLVSVQYELLAWVPCVQARCVWSHRSAFQQIYTRIGNDMYCLTVREPNNNSTTQTRSVQLLPCVDDSSHQKWRFDVHLDRDMLLNFYST